MSAAIRVFSKSKLDVSYDNVVLTASQGQDFVDFVRNRSNTSAWVTTGSVDADNTTIEVDFVDLINIDSIILIKHNFKSYTIQYWDGDSWENFSTTIAPTTNTALTTFHQFTEVFTTKIKLTILGTMTVDDDKHLFQFIATTERAQFNGFPIIKNPKHSRNRIRSKLLSGKETIKESSGAFSCQLQIKVHSDDSDLDLIEDMYNANTGFLVWLCGGDQAQFSSLRIGYRLEDIYLMKCADEYQPEWYKGFYTSGQVVGVDLVEVAD